MKFKSCSEKSPLKFLDADAERDSFVDYLKVQPHSKTREEETKEPEGIPSGLNQQQVPLHARSPINKMKMKIKTVLKVSICNFCSNFFSLVKYKKKGQ